MSVVKVELTPEMAQALLALCDSVPLRGPESKVLVAGAQAALLEALRGGSNLPVRQAGLADRPHAGPQK